MIAVLVFIGAAIYLGGVGGIILFFWTTLVWCGRGGANRGGPAGWMGGTSLFSCMLLLLWLVQGGGGPAT